MAVELKKEKVISLSEQFPSLQIGNIGLGWDTDCDIDSAIYPLDKDGRLIPGTHVYYQHKKEFGGAIILDKDSTTGDSRTGGSDKSGVPDENCRIDLRAIPDQVDSIAYGAWVYRGIASFGFLKGGFCELRDMTQNPTSMPLTAGYQDAVAAAPELVYHKIGGISHMANRAIYLGRIFRDGKGSWNYEAVEKGFLTREMMDNFFRNGIFNKD